ncbi:hypothetical protein R1sor_024587 [Riccia sorocarpa]|uniref:Uncharacterized protein n=1 Tax=Riccia sorocarpa TaxID=122646 RepID=A0ABD3GST7_9MARC
MAEEPIATPTVSQTTPRRRGRDPGEGPLGPDDLVTIGNVHRLVTHEMVYTVFPVNVQFGQESRLFKAVANRSCIHVMRDCTSEAMVDAVLDGFPAHYPDYFRCHGTPVRGLSFEFSLGFVKLLYARAVLGTRVDFSNRSAPDVRPDPAPEIPLSQTTQTQIPQTPRRVRPRVTLADEIDFGASPATSYAPIVPHGEGPSSGPSRPSSAPSTSSHTGWLLRTDRQAVWNWIERAAPFVLVDRQHHEAALRRLAESDGVEARLEREIEARLTLRRLITRGRFSQRLTLKSSARFRLRLRSTRLLPTLTTAEELEAAKKKVTELEAEVAGLKDQVKITADALKVERRRNFADVSELKTNSCVEAIRGYEDRHRALEAELAERMRSVTPEELTPERLRSTWELLQRYDASVHSLSGIATATHELVTKKYQNRRYDPIQLEGRHEAWNRVNDANDLSAIRHFFPGWAPLPKADEGSIGLSPIWHRAQCQVCLNYFGPEGGYLPGSYSHPIHLHCMLKLMAHRTQCLSCRAPYHSRMWFQFLAEKLIDGAAAQNGTAFYEAGREPFYWERDEERRHGLLVPFLKGVIIAYQLCNDQQQPLAARLELVEKYRQRAERDFADRRLQLEDRSPEYHLGRRVVELLHFYLCHSLASPGTYAEYGAELYSLVRRNWPPECFNWSEKFAPGLQHLDGGTLGSLRACFY